MSITRIIGIVLLVVGIVVLVLGAYNLIAHNSSTFGKATNKLAGAFGTQTKPVKNYIIQIAIGVACSAVGFVLYRKS